MLRTSGSVSAVDAAGSSRPLARGSEIFLGETISTGAESSTQLRLSDSSVLTLNADSEFSVNDYQFDGEGGAPDSVVMSMVRGSLRTISGTIGDGEDDTYQLNTPFASIGIRGTEYGVMVQANGRTFMVVFDGGIAVTPAGGGAPVLLGLGGTSDAADVADGLTIVELDQLPAELQQVINTVIEAVSEDELSELPAPEDAVEIQLQLQLQESTDDAGNTQTNLVAAATFTAAPGTTTTPPAAQGGLLVDAAGNALNAASEQQLQEARRTVVLTFSNVNPDLFDDSVKDGISPNR